MGYEGPLRAQKWSNNGQIKAKYWSNTGQILVKYGCWSSIDPATRMGIPGQNGQNGHGIRIEISIERSTVYFRKNMYQIFFDYDEFKQTKTAVIQSGTGTGKTTAIAKHMKQYISNDDTNVFKVLSIIDKITLGGQHLESFKKEEGNAEIAH